MKFLYLVALAAIFYSCSARWHLKQADRHERIAIEKGATINVDTVFKEIAVTVPELQFDTVVSYKTLLDTIFVADKKTGVKTKIKIDTVAKTASVETKVPEQKVIVKHIPVTVTKTIKCPPCRSDLLKLGAVFIIAFVLGFVVRSIFR